ncbi:hypothetical protein [Sedimenticola selenatireducens]|nr:hypothetical protein [Sedimenticola selenatireducens]
MIDKSLDCRRLTNLLESRHRVEYRDMIVMKRVVSIFKPQRQLAYATNQT